MIVVIGFSKQRQVGTIVSKMLISTYANLPLGYTLVVLGSILGSRGLEIFLTCSCLDRPWDPLSLLRNEFQDFLG